MALRTGRMRLDHLQLYAPSVEVGLTHLREALGVDIDFAAPDDACAQVESVTTCPGISLGDGIRMDIVTPSRARARGLEPAHFAARLAMGAFLGHWAVRLERPALLARLASDYPRRLDPVQLTCDGCGEQLVARRADGAWPRWRGAGDGILPTILQRRATLPPTRPSGLTLRALRGAHPAAEVVTEQLRWMGADAAITVEATLLEPELTAEIETPHGLRLLR